MIRFWLSRETSIPVREQLQAQLVLGIMSREIAPGERLPSVRDLARRLRIHANTVSTVYQSLAVRGWVRRRHGSGVFVCSERFPAESSSADAFASRCTAEGLAHGFTREALAAAFRKVLTPAEAPQLLVVDPDVEFARILAAEIGEAVGAPVLFACNADAAPPGSVVLSTAAHASKFPGSRTVALRSMQEVIAGHERPRAAVLIAVVSRSPAILEWSSTLLGALGFEAGSLVRRNPADPEWQAGLQVCDIVVADVIAAQEVPSTLNPVVVRVVSDDFSASLVTVSKVS